MIANEKYLSIIESGIAKYQNEVKLAQINNRQHKNIYGENFVRDMLNIIYDVSFINANSIEANLKGVDLVCTKSKRCIQVTSTTSTTKVKKSYELFMELDEFKNGYTLEFFYLLDKPKFDKITDPDVENLQETFFNFEDLIVEINDLEVDKLEKLSKLFIVNNVAENIKTLDENNLKRFLTHLPQNDIFIGRESELELIYKNLSDNKSLLLLNGIGGIGKTTLVKEYANRYIDKYDHIAFVEFSGDIKDSLISALKTHFNLQGDTPNELFANLKIELANIKGKNLLIVDDIKTQNDFNIIKDISANFELLTTSRIELNTKYKYKVETLAKAKAKELFLKSYKTNENIDNLLEYIGYHTLFIKLTAEALANNDTLTIQILETKFKNGEFGNISSLNDNFDEKNFNKYLQELFLANNLNENEILVLKRLTLFPSIDIEYKDLEVFLNIKEKDKQSFPLILNKLSKTGWLIKDNSTYKLHQITREFIIEDYRVSYEEVQDIVELFISLMVEVYRKKTIDSFYIIPYIVDFDKVIRTKNIDLATLCNNISSIYRNIGEFEKALEFQKKSLKIKEEILNLKHPDIATSYNNISLIYQDTGELEKALEFQKKALNLKKEILGEKDPNLATSYNNISLIYLDMKEFEKALEYQWKAIGLKQEVFGNKDINLAINYNNFSIIYQDIGKFKKALDFQFKALELREDLLGENDPDIAVSHNNISYLYQSMGRLDDALKHQLKTLDIRENIFDHSSPLLRKTYLDISKIYDDLGNTKESLRYKNMTLDNMGNTLNIIDDKEYSPKSFNLLIDNLPPALNIEKIAKVFSLYLVNYNSEDTSTILGIFGKWGRGKTYLFKEIKKYIKTDMNVDNIYFCDFQPWKYQETESAWAYLYERILNSYIEKDIDKSKDNKVKVFLKKIKRITYLNINRLGSLKLWISLILISMSVLFMFSSILDKYGIIKYFTGIFGVTGIIYFYKVYLFWTKNQSIAKNLIQNYLKKKSYSDYLGFQNEMETELRILLQTFIKKNEKLVLFVDDLDRCNEKMIIDIMDQLRLVLDDDEINSRLIIITAIDQRILRKAIKHKYLNKDEKKDIDIREYMEKFFLMAIQLGEINNYDISELVDKYTDKINSIDNEKVFKSLKDFEIIPKDENKSIQKDIVNKNNNTDIKKHSNDVESRTKTQKKISDLIGDNSNKKIDYKSFKKSNIEIEGQFETKYNTNTKELFILNDEEVSIIKSLLIKYKTSTPRKVNLTIHRYLLFKSFITTIIPKRIYKSFTYNMIIELVICSQKKKELTKLKEFYEKSEENELTIIVNGNSYVIDRNSYINLVKFAEMVSPF